MGVVLARGASAHCRDEGRQVLSRALEGRINKAARLEAGHPVLAAAAFLLSAPRISFFRGEGVPEAPVVGKAWKCYNDVLT